jgi:tagatose-1,6-bisphosphate aldolase
MGEANARRSRLLPDWSVEKARRLGAEAVKLLVYYHPDSLLAGEIEALVRQVVVDCAAQDLPLFLEPLLYSLDPARKKPSAEERRREVIETARRLTPLGVEVLKAEFPLDISTERDEGAWQAACAELSAASAVPWVLLSAAVDFETYLRQAGVACRAGASGVAVGRAVWQEAVHLTGEARATFLREVARGRLARLVALCDDLARSWTEFYSAPPVRPDWYVTY